MPYGSNNMKIDKKDPWMSESRENDDDHREA